MSSPRRALALAAALPLCALAGRADADELRTPVETYRLANGLQVVLHEDHSTPLVAVNLWYHVGSADETPGRTGFAHLFEHLMFEGSSHVAKNEFMARIDEAGGDLNGSTWTDATNYFEVVPANFLELALWLESDRMGWLLPTLDQAKLDNQREVVKNERRQRYENAPYGMVSKLLREALWPADHPYRHWTIGEHADLTAASLDDVRAFFRRWYAPNDATLVIAGDVDPLRARALVERYFGPIPRGPAAARVRPAAPPPLAKEIRITHRDRVQLPRLTLAWRSPAVFAPGDAELDLLAAVLGAGKASRLYAGLVYERRIAQDVSVAQASAQYGSSFEIVATAKPGHTLEELRAAIDAELERIRREPVTARELDRARNQFEASFVHRLEAVGQKANQLNYYNHYLGDPAGAPRDLARYRAATPEGLQRVAAEVLRPDGRVVIEVLPEPEAAPAAPAGREVSP